jgi:hypothetical protein
MTKTIYFPGGFRPRWAPNRLSAQHERIEVDAVLVNHGVEREFAQAVETLIGLRLDAAPHEWMLLAFTSQFSRPLARHDRSRQLEKL